MLKRSCAARGIANIICLAGSKAWFQPRFIFHQEYAGELSHLAHIYIFRSRILQESYVLGIVLYEAQWLRRKAIAAKSDVKTRCDCQEQMHDSRMKD